jgi:hypothetical protein
MRRNYIVSAMSTEMQQKIEEAGAILDQYNTLMPKDKLKAVNLQKVVGALDDIVVLFNKERGIVDRATPDA